MPPSPIFRALACSTTEAKNFLRDAPAGKRDAMQFARAIGRFDFVQPRAGDGAGQFVGGGEGNQFKVFHLIWEGRRVAVPRLNHGKIFIRP